MIVPTHVGEAIPMWRAPARSASMLGRFVSSKAISANARVLLVDAIEHSLTQTANGLARHVMCRAFRGARFAEDITAAATMVAAARH